MAEWIEGNGRRQRSRTRAPPGRIEKSPVMLSTASLTGEDRAEHLTQS
jgi:hypothetical protein